MIYVPLLTAEILSYQEKTFNLKHHLSKAGKYEKNLLKHFYWYLRNNFADTKSMRNKL